MKKIYLLIGLTSLFASELEVDGDLTVTGTIQNDSLQQVIAELQAQITMLQNQLGLVPDCEGIIGGSAQFDTCGICQGDNSLCTVYDIDGNFYNYIEIGNQTWMTENLKTTHYRNGDSIDYFNNTYVPQNTGAYFPTASFQKFGYLYNWYAAVDSRGVCPEGWHVPSIEEYKQLIVYLRTTYLDDSSQIELQTSIPVGGFLKSASSDYWNPPNTQASNLSGFSAKGAGYRSSNNGTYQSAYEWGDYWTSTSSLNGGSLPVQVRLFFDNANIYLMGNGGEGGSSIRCIQN